MVDRTLHRPRDLVQFCKYIQAEARDSRQLYFRTILNAEKKYSYWLVSSELANEINPILKRVDPVFDMLRLLGSRPFSLSDFYDRYKAVKEISMDVEELAYYLYDVGMIQNIDTSKPYAHIRSIIRNEGKLDRNQKMIIHIGVWRGLNA
ncbi:MAG: hypothetical protein LBU86_03440 [Oscillospiraceae bacterium]|nr:hypothetical protein [Oscillospiraceae bacterium]